MKKSTILTAFASMAIGAASASAMIVELGYNLSSHPNGGISPPPYGLRLDGLAGPNSEVTFDFDHASIPDGEEMMMFITHNTDTDVTTARIMGTVYGGEVDVAVNPNEYVDSAGTPLGLWDIDFTFNANVEVDARGVTPEQAFLDPTLDFGIVVTAEDNANNIGTIVSREDTDVAFDLQDQGKNIPGNGVYDDDGHSFYFNNIDDHRFGGSGLAGPIHHAGWGWLNHDPVVGGKAIGEDYYHDSASDFLYVGVTKPDGDTGGGEDPFGAVPEPLTGAMALMGLAGLSTSLRRRRS